MSQPNPVKVSPAISVAGPALYGVDIYHGDGDVQFHRLVDAGLSFVWLKATQGVTYHDPQFYTNWVRAKSVGLTRGAYHFFDPNADPIAQAAHLVNVVPTQAGDLVFALDIETAGDHVGERAYQCAQQIKKSTGRWPAIYSSDSFYRDNLRKYFPADMHLLWIARYGHAPVTPCAFWQYSESGSIAGVPHPLDVDVFHGDAAALASHCF